MLAPDARLRLYPGKGHLGTINHRPAIDEIGHSAAAAVVRLASAQRRAVGGPSGDLCP